VIERRRACRAVVVATLAIFASVACALDDPPARFVSLPPEETGVTFENRLPEDSAFNILEYLNYYNGGGVAAGDVNGDGLVDLYFTANVGPNRLYLNRGNFRFEDVTEQAGVVGPPGWKTGVAMADVNGDGHLDIYLSAVDYLGMHGRNVLYVNEGDGRFRDRTREFGLEHQGYSTQAAFFDYDRDGDLDMYLLNHSVHAERGASATPQREPRHPRAGDRLFRNDGNRFVDVSAQAGIYGGVEGYGLGVVASDVNLDGCIDLYVANDFQENDFLYLNNCDGTFRERIAAATGHVSRSSMGVDAADFDNDGRPDIVVLDMLPERQEVLTTSATHESAELLDRKMRAGYHAQYARNTLQLNRGGERFSEIGYLAGVAATDWSWSALFADLDDDGFKDLFVTNGIYRRPNDLDFIEYVGTAAIQSSLARGLTTRETAALLRLMPHVPLPNHLYRNRGDLTFEERAADWGLGEPGFSNGAVYVDLNDDGALDLVVNRIGAPAAIYRNRAPELGPHHYLTVELQGEGGNRFGIGASVTIWQGRRQQLVEQMPTRGFQSSVDPRVHFGLGGSSAIDSLRVIWPDGRMQRLGPIAGDRAIRLVQRDAVERATRREPAPAAPLFTDATARLGAELRHVENTFSDFLNEPLIPHRLSTEGPALAVGDADGDGLDDLFFGGAKWQVGRLLLQRRDGGFREEPQPALAADSIAEDVDAVFFDADGDGDRDLYVVSGGNEFRGEAAPLRDRLYLNDGRGRFVHAAEALPAAYENGARVVPADFDGDGDVDLFVGSRVVTKAYGMPPRSRLLRNDGTGRFADVTRELAPMLERVGMVTAAAWLDVDRDGRLDLIVVGEWLPVTVLRQGADGRFADHTAAVGLAGTEGWWNSVTVADLDGDGREDLVLGNLGLNSYLRASADEPARLYVHDFFGDGTVEPLLTFYKHGVSYPLAGRDELMRAMPRLRDRFTTYAAFGASTVERIVPSSELARARRLTARTFASAVAFAGADGRFTLRALPMEAQFAPVHAVVAEDMDGDGRVDLLLGGNFHGVTPVRGRYDASYGTLLRGDGRGTFTSVELERSGLAIDGQVRRMATLRHAGGGRLIAVARNDDRLLLLATPAGRSRDGGDP